MVPGGVSPQGDRLAFSRSSEDGTGDFVWTMPIDPKTGMATGQAQRVSLRPTTSGPKFSPDGKMLVFRAGPRPDGPGTGTEVIVVPSTGGAERTPPDQLDGHRDAPAIIDPGSTKIER